MKLLIFCPTYRLEPETVEAIYAQGVTADVMFTRDNPHADDDYGKANILHNYRKMREIVLERGYDAVLVIESDIIPPADALKKLLAAGGDIAYGLYLFRRGEPYPVNVFRYVKAKTPDMPISHFDDLYRKSWGKVIRCSGAGLGCALIRRRVLEAVDFTEDDAHCDTAFTRDVFRAGFTMMADLSVVCGHKLPDGRICWPDVSGRPRWTQGVTDGYRGTTASDPTERYERAVKRGVVQVQGATLRVRLLCSYAGPDGVFDAGQEYDWPLEAALRAIDGGNAEGIDGNH